MTEKIQTLHLRTAREVVRSVCFWSDRSFMALFRRRVPRRFIFYWITSSWGSGRLGEMGVRETQPFGKKRAGVLVFCGEVKKHKH